MPFNIVQYSLLTHLVAQAVGMAADEFIWIGGDCHVYKNQLDGVYEQLNRKRVDDSDPRVVLNPAITNLFDFTFDDIEIVGYKSQPKITFPPAAV